jgi:hypothetical protein
MLEIRFWVVAGNKLPNREGNRRRQRLNFNHHLDITQELNIECLY